MKLLVLAIILCGCSAPRFYTVGEVATWSKCEPVNISWWTAQTIEYKDTKGWESAEKCIARGTGDCKCLAVVPRDILKKCGYSSKVITIKNGKRLHAVVLYTDKSGRRGFINGVTQKSYEARTDWNKIISEISGGPWEEVRP